MSEHTHFTFLVIEHDSEEVQRFPSFLLLRLLPSKIKGNFPNTIRCHILERCFVPEHFAIPNCLGSRIRSLDAIESLALSRKLLSLYKHRATSQPSPPNRKKGICSNFGSYVCSYAVAEQKIEFGNRIQYTVFGVINVRTRKINNRNSCV